MKALLLVVSMFWASLACAQQTAAVYTIIQGSVTTSSSTALTVTAPIRDLLIQNNSDTDISCDPSGQAAVVGAGIVLKANGGFAQFPNYLAPVGIITCIHGGTGTKALNIILAR